MMVSNTSHQWVWADVSDYARLDNSHGRSTGTLILAFGYAWKDTGSTGTESLIFIVYEGTAKVPTADSTAGWTSGTDAYWTTSTDPTASGITLTTITASDLEGFTAYVDGEKVDLVSMVENDTITVGGIEITYSSSTYTFKVYGYGEYTLEFVLDDNYAWETTGSTGTESLIFIVYAGTAKVPTADSTAGWTSGTDANWIATDPAEGITLTTIEATDLVGFTVYVDGKGEGRLRHRDSEKPLPPHTVDSPGRSQHIPTNITERRVQSFAVYELFASE